MAGANIKTTREKMTPEEKLLKVIQGSQAAQQPRPAAPAAAAPVPVSEASPAATPATAATASSAPVSPVPVSSPTAVPPVKATERPAAPPSVKPAAAAPVPVTTTVPAATPAVETATARPALKLQPETKPPTPLVFRDEPETGSRRPSDEPAGVPVSATAATPAVGAPAVARAARRGPSRPRPARDAWFAFRVADAVTIAAVLLMLLLAALEIRAFMPAPVDPPGTVISTAGGGVVAPSPTPDLEQLVADFAARPLPSVSPDQVTDSTKPSGPASPLREQLKLKGFTTSAGTRQAIVADTKAGRLHVVAVGRTIRVADREIELKEMQPDQVVFVDGKERITVN